MFSFVILWEGLSGHGWVAPVVLVGAAATVLGLLILLGPDGAPAARPPPGAAPARRGSR